MKTGHDSSEFYEGGLEKGGFSKLNLRKVRRKGGGRTNIEGLRRGLKGGLRRGILKRETSTPLVSSFKQAKLGVFTFKEAVVNEVVPSHFQGKQPNAHTTSRAFSFSLRA